MRHLVDREPLAAVLEHLRHERQVLELATFVEGGEDLLGAEYFYNVADAKTLRSAGVACCVDRVNTCLPFTRDSPGGFANQSIAEMLPVVVCYLIKWQTTISLSMGPCHESGK